MVSEEHITAFNWASPQEIDDIMHMAIRINDFLSGLFLGIGIKLVDFKVEFGRLYENDMMRIVLADEISPDSCRLWDIKTQDKLDKDRFRRDMGGLVEAYQEVARRLGIMPEMRAARALAAEARQERLTMKAKIKVTLKKGVLDPQGKAIEGALGSLGFAGVEHVRQGKYFEIDLAETDHDKAKAAVDGHVQQAPRQHGDRELRDRARMKSAVVVFPGINRERDMMRALDVGHRPEAVAVWHADTELPKVDLVVVPGGFSYGDYLRCGAIAARSPIMADICAKAAAASRFSASATAFRSSPRRGCCRAR